MKQKDRLVSSLIIALVAGFIYYAYADFETISKIPQFAYQTIKSAVFPEKASTEPESVTDKNLTSVKKSDEVEANQTDSFDNEVITENAEYAQLPDHNYIFRYLRGMPIFTDEQIEKLEKLSDFGFNTDFSGRDMQFVNQVPEELNLDSHKIRVNVKIKNLDSINIYIDKSMEKLNESLSKLNEQLKSEEFRRDLPEIDTDDINVEVDTDAIKESIKESMKEFDENMMEFNSEMKEFKDSMKQFKESMKELKKNMKELDSARIKNFEKEIEIIES